MTEIISFFLGIIVTFKFSITVNFLKLVSLAFSEQFLKKKHPFIKEKKNVHDL